MIISFLGEVQQKKCIDVLKWAWQNVRGNLTPQQPLHSCQRRHKVQTTVYADRGKRNLKFLHLCNGLVLRGKPFEPIGETKIQIPRAFTYKNCFDLLRTGKYGIRTFGVDINANSFPSTARLSEATYVAKVFMNTKWSNTEQILQFCNSQRGAILAGPHGLALAIPQLNGILPLCKLLISPDANDANASCILSAGKCEDESWVLYQHRGSWAPGVMLVLFFEESEMLIGM